MVVVGKDNRYYKRRNFCAEPMTEEEVRIAYERNLSAAESLDRRYEQLRSKPDEDKYGFQVSILPRVDTDRFFLICGPLIRGERCPRSIQGS